MRNILCFDAMLTPKIITVLYWLLLAALLLAGFATMFSGMGGFSFFLGLMVFVLGALIVRIWCELFIVLFRIHDNLKKLADKAED